MDRSHLLALLVLSLSLGACGSQGRDRAAVTETVNRLFVATDNRDWSALHRIFADEVVFDMTSLSGGQATTLKAAQITQAWDQGLSGLVVHHLVGNHIVDVQGNEATVFCYGVATHYLKNPTGNNARTFGGSYEFGLKRAGGSWRVNRFKYNHKYLLGNPDLHKYAKR